MLAAIHKRKYRGSKEPGHRLSRLGGAVLALLVWSPAVLRAQNPSDTVGRIEGDDIAVKGQVSLLREGSRSIAALASGSEITVRSGQARLLLADGSEIDICGPAQFSVLKSGDAITLALSYGRLHARLAPALPLTIYTALVVATPVSIAGRPRDTVVGLDAGGAMCVLPAHGAMRLEQQLTGASLVVPQGGEMLLPDGQLDSLREAPEGCRCNVVLAEDRAPERPKPVQMNVSVAASPAKREEEKKEQPKTPAVELPTFTAVMPPLTFDASAPALPPEPSAGTVLLVREVRVRPVVVFTGRVESRASGKAETRRGGSARTSRAAEAKSGGGFGAAIKNFFRRVFGGRAKI